ncbi:hypothetical protein M3697_05305 [Janibacter melonis]|uniref:hypothetical protein n=1 Tax=Janibacter melonis TaxID=262209 RepID=UPI0020443B24|nr:hypothetical protein [Janibacter melonis]MCM3554523.1 hypothetical protein [Janibacter melonis]
MTEVLQSRNPTGYLLRMEIPEDLLVTGPHAFQTGPDGAERIDEWVRFEGGGVPVPLYARVERSTDGRFVCTGLAIGIEGHQELTWDTMRQIKPATLLSYIFAGFDPEDPFGNVRESFKRAAHQELTEAAVKAGRTQLTSEEVAEVLINSTEWTQRVTADDRRRAAAFGLWSYLTERDPMPEEGVARKPRASVATDLGRFATVYKKHLAASPRRATQATADELHCSRATVLRRIAEARKLGLIPPKDSAP